MLSYIKQGDCLKLMNEIPDNSVDLIITDPPYNISRPNNFKTMGSASRIGMDFGDWDKGFDLIGYIKLLPRILKENANIVIFSAWENLARIKYACQDNNIQIKRCLVLNKSNPAPFNRDRMFVNDVEFALWGVYNSKGKPKNWTFNRINKVEKCCIDTTVQSSKYHPTMKDIKLIQHLIEVLSNRGGVVLDPFLGSGTTALACINTERRYIGFEIDENYFNIAKERICSLINKQGEK